MILRRWLQRRQEKRQELDVRILEEGHAPEGLNTLERCCRWRSGAAPCAAPAGWSSSSGSHPRIRSSGFGLPSPLPVPNPEILPVAELLQRLNLLIYRLHELLQSVNPGIFSRDEPIQRLKLPIHGLDEPVQPVNPEIFPEISPSSDRISPFSDWMSWFSR